MEVDEREDSFEARFSVRHESDDIDFAWQRLDRGHAGRRDLASRWTAAATGLLYNRIGFCVLHPSGECAGRPFRGETPDGPVAGELPQPVGPQLFEDGVYVPLFPSVEPARDRPEPTARRRLRVRGRPVRDGGPAQLDRRLLQDLLHAARPRDPAQPDGGPGALPAGDVAGRGHGRRRPARRRAGPLESASRPAGTRAADRPGPVRRGSAPRRARAAAGAGAGAPAGRAARRGPRLAGRARARRGRGPGRRRGPRGRPVHPGVR